MRKVRKASNTVYHLSLFEKRKATAEMPLRLGFELHSDKVYTNLNIPFIIRFVARASSIKSTENKNAYGIQHITDYRAGTFFRTGFDSYKGEFAILLPFLKLWFQCDFLSNNFRQFGRFSILVFLLKIKWNELTFRIGVLGFRFSLRLFLPLSTQAH
jgi:hypothetical protein